MLRKLAWRRLPGTPVAVCLMALALFVLVSGPAAAQGSAAALKVDTGDTAWMLMSSALVMLMTPGLALFYGGMVRSKNVLNMLMQSFIALGVVTLVWVLWGYSLAFGPGGKFLGSLAWSGLQNVGLTPNADYAPTIPHQLYMIYQMMFAVITPALITAAIAERMKFPPTWYSWRYGVLLCTARWRTGSGDTTAGWERWAPSTSPAAPSSISAAASPRWWWPSHWAAGASIARGTRKSLGRITCP